MSESLPFGLSHVDAPLAERLRGGLADVETALYAAVRSDYPFVTEASSHLVAAGGKRFRPLLALVASCGGQRTNSPACSTRLSTVCGRIPMNSVSATVTAMASVVKLLGTTTLGPPSADGSLKNMSTMTRT